MKRIFISLIALTASAFLVSAADFFKLRNPGWTSTNNLSDPSVLKTTDGLHLRQV